MAEGVQCNPWLTRANAVSSLDGGEWNAAAETFAAELGIPSATLRRLYERGLACRCTRTGDAAVRWARTEMGERVLREDGR